MIKRLTAILSLIFVGFCVGATVTPANHLAQRICIVAALKNPAGPSFQTILQDMNATNPAADIAVPFEPGREGEVLSGRYEGIAREDLDHLEPFLVEASLAGYLLEQIVADPNDRGRVILKFQYHADLKLTNSYSFDPSSLMSSFSRDHPFKRTFSAQRSKLILFVTGAGFRAFRNQAKYNTPLSFLIVRGETVVRIGRIPTAKHFMVGSNEDAYAAGELTVWGSDEQSIFDHIEINNQSGSYQLSDPLTLLQTRRVLELRGVKAKKWTYKIVSYRKTVNPVSESAAPIQEEYLEDITSRLEPLYETLN